MCKYCEEEINELTSDKSNFDIYISDKDLYVSVSIPTGFGSEGDYVELQINYCPMCGRKL